MGGTRGIRLAHDPPEAEGRCFSTQHVTETTGFRVRSTQCEAGFPNPSEHRNLSSFACVILSSQTNRGLVFGVFRMLQQLQIDPPTDVPPWSTKELVSQPSTALRMWNCWDNVDGT